MPSFSFCQRLHISNILAAIGDQQQSETAIYTHIDELIPITKSVAGQEVHIDVLIPAVAGQEVP